MRVLVIDNYDSFTYNLVQYLGQHNCKVDVFRNDQISLDEITALAPDKILISPGPCTPDEAGICVSLIQKFSGIYPIFGVCLGHQAIGQAFGAAIVRNKQIMHGKVSPIHHNSKGVFRNLPNPFNATRYHSLVIAADTLPSCLETTAWTTEGEIMGVKHKEYGVEGVQFHPESALTENGMQMIFNFLEA